jgi:hypothetical protein
MMETQAQQHSFVLNYSAFLGYNNSEQLVNFVSLSLSEMTLSLPEKLGIVLLNGSPQLEAGSRFFCNVKHVHTRDKDNPESCNSSSAPASDPQLVAKCSQRKGKIRAFLRACDSKAWTGSRESFKYCTTTSEIHKDLYRGTTRQSFRRVD